ncbi:ArnT family glycosyltransferase [Tellurirhabdus rosea]|uniref:ArnT family glycosyltransferase n=1 Tax=Tellurirhabdus rosea TaxID=2674997 RepID=UPI002259BC7B|nr:glycosyltransferase family 39 protein [Tellurirhabdus rosea]
MLKIQPRRYPLLLAFLGILFYIPFLGAVHLFDWDEINFAESAREMLVTGNYTRVQINFQPFWEKPPLFFWMQALCMKIFGVGEFAARLPNALIGIVTLQVLYSFGRKLVNERFGLIWALAYFASLTPHLYFKTGIIDPTFNLFIFIGTWQMAGAVAAYGTSAATRRAAFSGLFIGLAVLTKGPVGGLLLGLTFLIYWGLQRFRPILSFKNGLLFVGCALLVASLWFGLEVAKNGFWFLEEFITYQIRLFSTPDAGHAQPFYYHFVVVLLGCFPMSLFAIKGLAKPTEASPLDFRRWMVILFWVVMILFSIVKTKIVHYSSMAWFPVSFLAASVIYGYLEGKVKWNRGLTAGLASIGILLAILLTALPIVGMNANALIPYVKDRFAAANLTAPVEWMGWEWMIGALFGLAIVWSLVQHARKPAKALLTMAFAVPVMLWLLLPLVVPNIERYVQGAVIDFYEARQGQDIYMEPIGYKSYAHLFYFRKQPPQNPKSYDESWLVNGPVDKPAYFVTRNINADDYRYNPNLEVIGEEAGWVFFRRKPGFKE